MAGITIQRNRTNVYAYATTSFRNSNKKPDNHRKPFAILILGTNKLVFNSFGMAILKSQNILLETLNNKTIK
jgi:hypothetical protein